MTLFVRSSLRVSVGSTVVMLIALADRLRKDNPNSTVGKNNPTYTINLGLLGLTVTHEQLATDRE